MPILTRTHDRIVADYECAIDNLEAELDTLRRERDDWAGHAGAACQERDRAYRNLDAVNRARAKELHVLADAKLVVDEARDRIRDLELERDSAIRHAQHTFADTLRMHHERDEAIGCHDAAAAMVQAALDENDELRDSCDSIIRACEHHANTSRMWQEKCEQTEIRLHERCHDLGDEEHRADVAEAALDIAKRENDDLRAIIADFRRELEHAVTAAVVVTAAVFAVDQLGEATIVGTSWAADFAEAAV